MPSEKKTAALNLLRVFLSNVLGLAASILAGFLIPKIMSISDYGYYKTFTLYTSYVALLHFGITDGVYLFYSGKSLDELDQHRMHSIIVFILLLESVVSIVGCVAFLPFSQNWNYTIVFIFVAIYTLVYHYESMLRVILEATKQFRYESIFLTINSLIDVLVILSFWAMSKTISGFELYFYYYCAMVIGLMIFLSFSYSVKLRKFLFTRGQDISLTKSDVLLYMKLGLPLVICNLTSSFINSIDRQFVSAFYPVEASNTFAEYSFAYSMLTFITTATAAVSTVLFPYMKGREEKKLVQMYPVMFSAIVSFVALAFLSFFFFEWFIPFFLPKYNNSLPIFRVLLPGLILECPVTIIMHNYYKTFGLEKRFLVINLVTLALTIGTDFLAYYCIILNVDATNPIWFSVASIFCMTIWYFSAEIPLIKRFGVKHWKNDIFVYLSIVLFYVIAFFLDQRWWIGFLVYFACISLTICFFYWKEGKQVFSAFVEKKKNKNAKENVEKN